MKFIKKITNVQDVNAKVYGCEDCKTLYIVKEKYWMSLVYPALSGRKCNICHGLLEELCYLHRKREGYIGFMDKCGICEHRFLCASSTPYAIG